MKKQLALAILPLATTLACTANAPTAPSQPASLTTTDLPKGVVKITDVVPGMGEHWANPADLPLGPIYGVKDGKVIFLEYMISQDDFKAGKTWPDMKNELKGKLPAIDHVDTEFQAQGHEGFTVPHYDMHIYFVSHADHLAYKP